MDLFKTYSLLQEFWRYWIITAKCAVVIWSKQNLHESFMSSRNLTLFLISLHNADLKKPLNFGIFTSILSSASAASSISGAPGGNNKNPVASSGKASKSCCAPLALRPLERNKAFPRNSKPFN